MLKKLCAVAAALSLSLPVLGARAEAKYDVSQVVATASFAFLPMYVAEHMGYFAAEGVNLKTVNANSAQAALAAVANGTSAYYLAAPVAGARSAAQGARILNCGALMTQNPTNIVISAAVAKKHGITEPAKLTMEQRIGLLKGLRLAAHTPGSSPDLTLRYLLQRSGIDAERDVQILPIVQGAILAALERDRIDGFAYSSPLADAAAVQYGAKKMISLASGEYQPLAGQLSISLVCNRDWVEKQPEAAAAVLRAIWRGMKLMKSDPAKAREAARKAFPNLEEPVFNAAFDTNLRAFPDSPTISREQMLAALDFHVKTGGAPISVKVEDTYTNAAVELAAKGMK
ncbi:MAG TPA: ABC transporter substrate-binding protein [Ramlibacter sp.]|nr:ABC transporter substrate-binding protein [Ramlibacter sp.]